MTLKPFVTMVALVSLVGIGIARADWLDDAWSEDSVRINGNPAVSISSYTIHVVLPTATLRQAHDEGVTTEDALRDFLDRHGQHCSHLVDLNAPHPNLKVGLSLQARLPLEDISSEREDISSERDEALNALIAAYVRYRTDGSVPVLLTVSPITFEFSINYVPTRQVRCIAPGHDDPTS